MGQSLNSNKKENKHQYQHYFNNFTSPIKKNRLEYKSPVKYFRNQNSANQTKKTPVKALSRN